METQVDAVTAADVQRIQGNDRYATAAAVTELAVALIEITADGNWSNGP